MDKRGLIGKIILIFLIIVILVIAAVGLTILQLYNFYKVYQEEKATLEIRAESISINDCPKLESVEASVNRLTKEAESMCKNPLIKISLDKISKIPLKCGDISSLKNERMADLAPLKAACENYTITKLP